jgi:hypothetical protein
MATRDRSRHLVCWASSTVYVFRSHPEHGPCETGALALAVARRSPAAAHAARVRTSQHVEREPCHEVPMRRRVLSSQSAGGKFVDGEHTHMAAIWC